MCCSFSEREDRKHNFTNFFLSHTERTGYEWETTQTEHLIDGKLKFNWTMTSMEWFRNDSSEFGFKCVILQRLAIDRNQITWNLKWAHCVDCLFWSPCQERKTSSVFSNAVYSIPVSHHDKVHRDNAQHSVCSAFYSR